MTSANSKILCEATTVTLLDIDLPVLGLVFTAIFDSLALDRESTIATVKDYYRVCVVALVCHSWKEALLKHCAHYKTDDIISAIIALHPTDSARDVLHHANNYAKSHKGVAMAAVKFHGPSLKYFHMNVRDMEPIVMEAVSNSGYALRYASARLKDDMDIVTTAVERCGGALKYASRRMRDIEFIVLDAVWDDGTALEYASRRIRNIKHIVRDAVSEDGGALACASPRLKNNKDVAMAAVAAKNDRWVIPPMMLMSEEMRRDKDVTMEAVKYDAMSVQDSLYPNACNDPEVMMQVVKYDGRGLEFGESEVRSNRDIVSKAIETSPLAFTYAENAAAFDQELLIKAVGYMSGMMRNSWVSDADRLEARSTVCKWVDRMGLSHHEHHCLLSKIKTDPFLF